MAANKTAKVVEDEKVEAAVEAGEAVMAAPVMNINTANGAGSQITEAEMKRDVERAAAVLGEMPTKAISIPKQMAPILGDTIRAFINGAEIRVPVDGESYDIPAPYYDIIKDSMKTVNSGDVRADYNLGKDVDNEALVTPTKR